MRARCDLGRRRDIGTALGPALGGVLTELFDWRAIFAVQAPLAAAAVAAALHPAARALPPEREGPHPAGSALALVFTYAALVGALFLAVLLIVTVWDYGPLAGAGVVSALPVAALCARPLSARLSGLADVVGGAALLAAGLWRWRFSRPAAPPMRCPRSRSRVSASGSRCLRSRAHLCRARGPDAERHHLGRRSGTSASSSACSRSRRCSRSELDDAEETATQNATAVILDAELSLTTKIPITLDLYREFQQVAGG